ncbi:Aldehyde/histidinol dehydrogenase [Boletus coccyginus]|nr:Aldehyde/histidinol dehydrogenase [Boletus coccyginus]
MSGSTYASIDQINQLHGKLTKTFKDGRTLPLAYRRRQLLQLAHLVQDNYEKIEHALGVDLGKHPLEARLPELGPIITGALDAANKLEEWNAPEKPQVEHWRSGWDTTILKVPKGAVLLISTWDFPWAIALLPLIGAIAAGCTCLINPSEHAPASGVLMAELIQKYLDPDAYAVCLGAVPETAEVLKLKWDHIFYTGSTNGGRIAAGAAAKHVTPLTLLLGSQSPVFLDVANISSPELEVAARRILWGKQFNCGQASVAPNHVFVEEQYQSVVVESLKKAYDSFWPKGPLDASSGLARLINDRHYERIKSILKGTHGKIELGDAGKNLRIRPEIVTNVKLDDPLLEGEIYGPILPIVPVANVDSAIAYIQAGPTPLVIYVFTKSDETKNKFIHGTQSGQLVLNDTVGQLMVSEIPFGGQGESGYGSYLGKFSFDNFIHKRGSINVPLDQQTEGFMMGRYPPYSQPALDFFSQALKVKIPDA